MRIAHPVGTFCQNPRICETRSGKRAQYKDYFWELVSDRRGPHFPRKKSHMGYPTGKPAMAPQRGRPKHTDPGVSRVPKIKNQYPCGYWCQCLGYREVSLALNHLTGDRVILDQLLQQGTCLVNRDTKYLTDSSSSQRFSGTA